MTTALTIDACGPISDTAGVAEMAGLPETMCSLTDCLDAAGYTMAAIGKGFRHRFRCLAELDAIRRVHGAGEGVER